MVNNVVDVDKLAETRVNKALLIGSNSNFMVVSGLLGDVKTAIVMVIDVLEVKRYNLAR